MPIYNIENPYLPQVINLKNEDGSPILGYNASLNDILAQTMLGNQSIANNINVLNSYTQGSYVESNQFFCSISEFVFNTFYQGGGIPARKKALIQVFNPLNGHTTSAHLKVYGIAGAYSPDNFPFPYQSVQIQVKNLHNGNYVNQMPLNETGLFLVELEQLFSRLIIVTEEISTDLTFSITLL